MNKILLTSICAAALTSVASAFTLDLNSISGNTIGSQTINQEGTSFTVAAGVGGPISGQVSPGGILTVNSNSTVIISYDNTAVSYTGTDTVLGTLITDTGSALVLSTGSVAGVNFDAVPEPSSTALLGLGGLALILRRRK